MKPERTTYGDQPREDSVRFHIDDVLQSPGEFDLQHEYRLLAEAYRSLNRKLYKILFISDLYQAERLHGNEKTVLPRDQHYDDSQSDDAEEFVERLREIEPELAEKAEQQRLRYRKLQNRLNKLISISDRFQNLLHQSNRNKDSFISNLSHELRTPLGTVLGIADLLMKTELNDEQKSLVDILMQAGNNLMHIVDDVLDLSRVQAGHIVIEQIPFHLSETLQGLIVQFQHHRYRRNVELQLQIDENVPDRIISDPHRLGQILSNLLSNALKFTERGTVTLSARLVTASDKQIQFEVIDTGTGIEPDRIPRLFERFVQEDGSISRRYGGTGLGLSIVRELVRLMGGSISVASEKGKGSTFTVILPVKEFEGRQGSGETRNSMRRVLIAEDAPEQRWLLERFLAGESIEYTVVESGPEAVQAARESEYDLILLDLQLPELDGFATLAEIRKAEASRQVPIIALTGRASNEDRQHAIAAGFTDHVAKPYTKERLVEMMDHYLK